MFSTIKDALARRKLKKLFGRYMTEDGFNECWESRDKPLIPKTCELCIVVIQFDAVETVALEAMLSSCLDLAVVHKGVVDSFVSHLVVVCFGMRDWSPIEGYRAYVEALTTNFGKHVKVSYSSGAGLVGIFGSAKRMSYTFIHPAFPKVLAELGTMPWGEAHGVLWPNAV